MSRPSPNAIFKSVMAKTAEGNLITEDGENLFKLYRDELTEAYDLPKDFSEVRHIETHKGEQIGLIASLAVHFINYHLLGKVLAEIPEIKQFIDQALGEQYIANATEWTGGNLNHISQIISVDSLGDDWREQAKASHQKMIEESAPLRHRTIIMTATDDSEGAENE
ncbi:hypothetical protein SAMN05660772_00992 [Pasteurella testudinis DSM 23072]|uniref:Uncharacterized protein n=1 Tax=Pasteurella testudinis DSM 23072 TaxID=1122938 RepID=A0A1W1V2A8_9PAST|nr:hypothetical protein [Pasteurella testudinis]SMB87517.1 hypothetical protein SAMN05660772_00992 [Pasteurella testudinis DSM 23072]SUB50527.1 Uncharacterised protein [Pasteurella testudinis]